MKATFSVLITAIAAVSAITFPGTQVEKSSTTSYTTSTVYTTTTYTVTSCATTVTSCSEIGSVVTDTISLYTTTCPVTTDAPTTSVVPQPTLLPETYLTKTDKTTIWYTITDCAPTVTSCAASRETSSVSTYTIIYPENEEITSTYNSSTTQPSKPLATGYPNFKTVSPKSNVTLPVVPPNTIMSGASAHKVGDLLAFCSLAIAATTIL